MPPSYISQAGYDGVAEGMFEVQEYAQSAHALVMADDFGLDRDRAHDSVLERVRVAREQAIEVGLEPVEERRVADQAVLDHFGQPREQLALGQGLQRFNAGQHKPGLMKGADQVFPRRMMNRGLATDR